MHARSDIRARLQSPSFPCVDDAARPRLLRQCPARHLASLPLLATESLNHAEVHVTFAISRVLVSVGAQVLFAPTVVLAYPMHYPARACPSMSSCFWVNGLADISEPMVADRGVCASGWWVGVRGWQALLFREVVNFCFPALRELSLRWAISVLWCGSNL
ncbi:hypothetical protein ARMSODRAFT_965002 [Armillaria solidipes]|uniref:Uncharacterized protein n=1 Tax=Armillaria solidipes TaxID=1076256 RepID=A0A2H3BC68_9AGAR|nr:hypothetical protein ARMSODRAFT_965002 [Armillaria solidipes]